MQHPWVSGSAWMALAPDMSLARHGLQGDPGYQAELAAWGSCPLASFNAEDVAAVVFPEMTADLAGALRCGEGSTEGAAAGVG